MIGTTFPFSTQRVNITIMEDSCSRTIRQKSSSVSGLGPSKEDFIKYFSFN